MTAGVSSETPSISIAYAEDAHAARAVYARILPLARLDMRPKLVQYFKAAMDLTGRHGGPCRPPRLELSESEGRELKEAVAALGAGVTA